MSATEFETPRESEGERVISWRVEELLRAGYCGEAALELALTPEVDLHLAIDLLRQGCPAPTAVRILL